jgi:hypothetical protein
VVLSILQLNLFPFTVFNGAMFDALGIVCKKVRIKNCNKLIKIIADYFD